MLLSHFSHGEEWAMKEIFVRYYRALVFFAVQILDVKEDAEDVVINVFSKLWTNRERMATVNQLKPFLYATVKNACLDLIRQQKKFSREQVSEEFWMERAEDDSWTLEVTKAEVIKIIHQQINELPDKCRQVFLLSYVEGLSTQQVADQLGISVSNVTSQRSRAVQLLRKSIMDKQVWAMLMVILRQF